MNTLVLNNYSEMTLGEIAASNIHKGLVLRNMGLDFCCRGNRTLSQAAQERKVPVEEVIQELLAVEHMGNTSRLNYTGWSAIFLAQFIVENHHTYIKKALPEITEMLKKVVSVHGRNHPELLELKDLFNSVANDLLDHLPKEEEVLFPWVETLTHIAEGRAVKQLPPFGSADNPIHVMRDEHQAVGDLLEKIETVTNNYTPPADACATYNLVFRYLKEFAEDLVLHIHLENNILFHKIIALEKTAFGK